VHAHLLDVCWGLLTCGIARDPSNMTETSPFARIRSPHVISYEAVTIQAVPDLLQVRGRARVVVLVGRHAAHPLYVAGPSLIPSGKTAKSSALHVYEQTTRDLVCVLPAAGGVWGPSCNGWITF
jgi:hypothetical protein